jgi:pimeloyl-ACP methyl ester carboxylesterase
VSKKSSANSLATVGGKRIEYQLVGSGEPNVVFLNGFRMDLDSWSKVYPQVAQDGRALLFN